MTSSSLPILLMLVGFVLILAFQSRKQRKQYQKTKDFQDSLVPGVDIQTTSGLYGTIVSTDEDTVSIEIAPGITTVWNRAAVAARPECVEAQAQDEADPEQNSDPDVDYTTGEVK